MRATQPASGPISAFRISSGLTNQMLKVQTLCSCPCLDCTPEALLILALNLNEFETTLALLKAIANAASMGFSCLAYLVPAHRCQQAHRNRDLRAIVS